jgi:sterol 3beta-glucosyltransferase
MKILLLTFGSRGDVQPFIALAVELQRRGHVVQLALPGVLSGLAKEFKIACIPLPGDVASLSRSFNAARGNLIKQIRAMQTHALAIAPQVLQTMLAHVPQADLVVHSFMFAHGAHTLARQHGIPDVSAQFFPIFAPTPSFPAIGFPELPLGSGYNRLTHHVNTFLFFRLGAASYPLLRRKIPGAPPRLYWPFTPTSNRAITPLIFAISRHVFPAGTQWPAHVHTPGYFFLDEPGYQPPPALADFLSRGSPPVCVGFGSMLNPQALQIQDALLSGLRASRARAVILTGWDGWQAVRDLHVSDDLLFLESAPHAWLFPRCRAVLHHAGAGVTAAALRASVPQIVLPLAADQPFWAKRMHALGVSPAPLTPARLSAEALQAALHTLDADPTYRDRAARLGELVRAEDGVGAAARVLEAQVSPIS